MATIPANLAQAWRAIRDDPVGILLPAGAILGLQVVAAMGIQQGWQRQGVQGVIAAAVVAVTVRVLLAAPFRARMLVAGARSMGQQARGRWLPLIGVHLVVVPLQLLVAGPCIAGAVLAAGTVAAHGWYTTAALAFLLGIAAATFGALLVRALFAFAPVEVVVGGRSGSGALWASLQQAARETLPALVLLGVGDLLVGLGALVCGAGALPGYPVSDLALMDRWLSRTGAPR